MSIDEAQIRLEAVKLASGYMSPDRVIETAKEIYEFVAGAAEGEDTAHLILMGEIRALRGRVLKLENRR